MPAHSIRNDNQISHGDQTGCQEKFHRGGRPRIPTGDLFVVADLLVCYLRAVGRKVLWSSACVCVSVCLCVRTVLSARYLKNGFMDHHQIWWVGAGGEPLEQVQFWC